MHGSGAHASRSPFRLDRSGLPSLAGGRLAVIAAVALIMLLSAFVRFYHLSSPKGFVFDEVYYAKDAETIIKGDIGPRKDYHWMPGDEVSWPHAEYGKMAIALGILAFGDHEFGWRFMPAIAGLALLLCVYPIARRLGLSREWSLAALLLAAVDFLGITQSRTATLDIFVALWTVLTVYLTLRYVQDGRRWYWLLLAGVSAGLAIGTKWSGLWGIVAAIVLIVVFRPRRKESARYRGAGAGPLRLLREPVLVALFLIVLPVGLYMASYGLYFAHGHTMKDWWDLQQQMWTFNTHLTATHPYASPANTWILDYRPVWYYFKSVGDTYHGVIAMGHPLIWWSSVLALVALPVAAIVDRNRALVLPSVLVAALYFFWFAFGRTSFLFYMMPVAPFMAILVAAALARLARRPPRLSADGTTARDLAAERRPQPAPGAETAAGADMEAAAQERAGTEAAAPTPPVRRRAERPAAEEWRLQPLLVFLASAAVVAMFWYPIGAGVAYIFYDLPAMIAPVVGIAVASLAGVAVIVTLAALASNERYANFWRVAGWIFVGACAGLLVAYLPIIIDLGISREEWSRLMWLPSWI